MTILAPALMREALDYATDPITGEQFPLSDQRGHWMRAKRELLAAQFGDVPVTQFSERHLVAIAQSALARVLCEIDEVTWSKALAGSIAERRIPLDDLPERLPGVLAELAASYRRADDAPPDTLTSGGWGFAVTRLIRTMGGYVARREGARGETTRFAALAKCTAPRKLDEQLKQFAAGLGARVEASDAPRYSDAEARAILLALQDPRQRLWSCLASQLNGRMACELRRSQLRVDAGGGVSVHRNSGSRV